jgi:GT2 family glycosyltransferase
MKVSVIIPNFNGQSFLKNCLDSLYNQKIPLEVIVIDNGSEDGSVDYIKSISNIILIENKENLGFAKAVNQGIAISSNEFVFLLNNDTVIEKNTIFHLLNCINKNENIFSVASKMLQLKDKNLIDDAGDEYTILGHAKKRGLNKLSTKKKYNEEKEIFSSSAGAALYRKDIFEEIGYFDEIFFAYMEDVDIGYRSKIFGYKNIYCPKSIVYHVGSGTSGSQYNEFKVKLAAKNNVLVPYKNMPLPQLALNIIFILIGFFIKYIFFIRKGLGKYYIEGLKNGFKETKSVEKIKYSNKNLLNYFKIQKELIINLFK